MKKILLAAALLSFGLSAEAKFVSPEAITASVTDPKWMKSETGTWMGANKTWYKLNMDDASVWMSKDGKKWEAAKDGMWQDKDGKWLKIVDKDLKWSKDGKSWASVPKWTWQGSDNKWYMFDDKWTLWTAEKAS